MLNDLFVRAVVLVPSIIPHLGGGFYKTYDYMLGVIERLVRGVYNGNVGGDFVDALGNLLTGQITQAFRQAYEDEGFTDMFPPEYLQIALNAMLTQHVKFDWIYQYYKDIVDARVDETPMQPLLARAALWANRYNEAYNAAILAIQSANGGKLVWEIGETEEHCPACRDLNGIVAYASEWELAGCKPQNAPNPALTGDRDGEKGCEGWRCDCRLIPTTKRRSPKAFDKIMKARL